jgi:hypothetical protein
MPFECKLIFQLYTSSRSTIILPNPNYRPGSAECEDFKMTGLAIDQQIKWRLLNSSDYAKTSLVQPYQRAPISRASDFSGVRRQHLAVAQSVLATDFTVRVVGMSMLPFNKVVQMIFTPRRQPLQLLCNMEKTQFFSMKIGVSEIHFKPLVLSTQDLATVNRIRKTVSQIFAEPVIVSSKKLDWLAELKALICRQDCSSHTMDVARESQDQLQWISCATGPSDDYLPQLCLDCSEDEKRLSETSSSFTINASQHRADQQKLPEAGVGTSKPGVAVEGSPQPVLSHEWLSDIVRYLREHGGSQGVMMTSLGAKVLRMLPVNLMGSGTRPLGLKKLLKSAEAVCAGISISGKKLSTVVTLKEPQHLSQVRLDEDQKRLSESVRNVSKAIECQQELLAMAKNVGDRKGESQAYGCPKCLAKFPTWSVCLGHLRETGHVETTSMKVIQQLCMNDAWVLTGAQKRAALKQWLSDIVRYLGEHGGSQGVLMTSLEEKVRRPVGLKVKLEKLLLYSEEAVRAGVSVTGSSPWTVVSLKQPKDKDAGMEDQIAEDAGKDTEDQDADKDSENVEDAEDQDLLEDAEVEDAEEQHEPQRILMDILRVSGGEMSASDLCSKLYQQSDVARDHVREEYGSFKAFLTTTALKDEVDFVQDQGCGKVVLKTQAKTFQGTDGKAAPAPAPAAAKVAAVTPQGTDATRDKNGPHKVFLRHTQLSARLYETFHSEHKVTSLAGTLQSRICLFDDTGEDVCYVESKKSKEHALTAAHEVDDILDECSQRLKESDGHEQDSEAALSQRWLSDMVRYLGEHGGSQGVMMTSLGEKVRRPVGLKVKLGKLLLSEEAVRAGVSVTGSSPWTVVSLKQPQHAPQRILMDILRVSGGEMSASDLCSKLYQQSDVARDHVREEYGSFKAFLTTTALKDEVDFVQDQGCGKVVLKTQAKTFQGTDGKAAPAPAPAAAKVAAVTPQGTDATRDKNGPHKVFLRHTQLSARLYETFHSEHKVTSLAGTLQSRICLFDDTGEDVCYVESKKSKEHALTAAHEVDDILDECSQRLKESDGHEQDSEAALSQRWLSDMVRYLGEHGGSQGVMMTSLGEKVRRPVGLKVKLGKLLLSEEAVRAGVSVTGSSPWTVVSLKQPQHAPQRILMDILRVSGGEMSASDLCSKLYQQSDVARDHVREEYGSFKAFLTTTALKDEVDFVQDQGCGKVVLKTQAKTFQGTDGKAAPAPAPAAAKVAAVTPQGTDATRDKNGPHKVFLRHTQLSARLYETFHSEHKVTSLAGTLQSRICLFDDTGEDVCYVESKKSKEHALTAAHEVDDILDECSQRLKESDGHEQDSEAALSQRWLSDMVRYLGEHGGSQGVMMTSLGEKVRRPVGLKVKLGKLLLSEEAVRAGVSVTGSSPWTVVSLKQPQHAPQRILMDILRVSGGEMSASDLCSKLYQQSDVARDHVREEYGSFKAFLTTTALKDEVDFVQDQGCGKVVLKTQAKTFQGTDGKAAPAPAPAAAKVAAVTPQGTDATRDKNGPHKVFLRHTQLSARLYETFHSEHKVTSLAGTLQSRICLFDDTGEDVCYVESKKSKEHALTAAHEVDDILDECSQRLKESDGHEQDSEAALSQRWLSDMVRYLGEHGGSQGVMMTSLGEKVRRPVGLKVKLGKLLLSEEAVRAGVSVTGSSPWTVVSLKQPQHAPQRILMDILRVSGGEMSASDLCSKLYQQSDVARDHVREEYGSFKAFLTTTALKDEVDFVQDQGCGKVVLKTQAKTFQGTDGKAAPAPAPAAAKVAAVTPQGTDATRDKNGPHKVFLRHTQLSARLYETFHSEHKVTSLAGTLQSRICLFDDTGEDVCYVESKKSKEHALTAAHEVDDILDECSQRLKESDGHEQDSEAALSQRWLSDMVRYLGEHGGSQGVMMTSLGEKVRRPVGLKVKLGKLLLSEEAVRAGVSVTGSSPWTVVSLKQPQHAPQRILMDILR